MGTVGAATAALVLIVHVDDSGCPQGEDLAVLVQRGHLSAASRQLRTVSRRRRTGADVADDLRQGRRRDRLGRVDSRDAAGRGNAALVCRSDRVRRSATTTASRRANSTRSSPGRLAERRTAICNTKLPEVPAAHGLGAWQAGRSNCPMPQAYTVGARRDAGLQRGDDSRPTFTDVKWVKAVDLLPGIPSMVGAPTSASKAARSCGLGTWRRCGGSAERCGVQDSGGRKAPPEGRLQEIVAGRAESPRRQEHHRPVLHRGAAVGQVH